MKVYVVLANLGSARLFETKVMGIVCDRAEAESCKVDSQKSLSSLGGGVTVSVQEYELNDGFAQRLQENL